MSRGLITCVVDTAPTFQLEALRWYASATQCADIAPHDLVIHSLASTPSDVLSFLESEGVQVVPIAPFDARSPHCNKIAGALSLAERVETGPIVLTDSDVAILSDPRSLSPGAPGQMIGKTVDGPNPPIEILDRVFADAGVPLPAAVPLEWMPDLTTRATNLNGGLYVLRAEDLAKLALSWSKWARYMLDRRDLLENWGIHVDQVAMALAIASSGLTVEALPAEWNFPTHRPGRIPPAIAEPQVLHYHRNVDAIGRLLPVGRAEVDEQIRRVNAAFSDLLKRFFPNRSFWNWRYATNPDLGSGVGSRGDARELKQRVLKDLERILQPKSVLDIGCGDGTVSKGIFAGHYTGFDLSEEALTQARHHHPNGSFLSGTLGDHSVHADLAICLDVLIHQPDPESYRRLVSDALAGGRVATIISGYDRAPSSDSPMIYFHEALWDTLRNLSPAAELYPVFQLNETVAYLVLHATGAHRRDFSADTLAGVARQHPLPMLLLELRLLARQTLGFYPDHPPRLWEYPAVAEEILRSESIGLVVADIGAGVNPLVPFLASRGLRVHTIDPSHSVRVLPFTEDVNEWGFFDYASAGMAERSWNCTLDAVDPGVRFDLAYSVSVIEHLPAADRRALLGDLSDRLRPGGRVILTVDLVRDARTLWNRSEGKMVDPPEEHGTLDELCSEAAAVGLDVLSTTVIHDWGETPVDIGWLEMSKSSSSEVYAHVTPPGVKWLAIAWELVRPLIPRQIRAWAFPWLRRLYYAAFPGGRR